MIGYHAGMNESYWPPAVTLDGRMINISAFGRDWQLRQAANLEELWEAMGEDGFEDERIPYWAELWPASLVLARWLCDVQARIQGRVCIEPGCGLGFTAMIGKWLGADVLACDYELPALENARDNISLNGIGQPAWLAMDWRAPAFAGKCAACIWAADVIYEKRSVLPILDFLESCLEPGGCVWLAEPGRAVFRHFLELGEARGWQTEKVMIQKVRSWYPQEAGITVNIWEAARK